MTAQLRATTTNSSDYLASLWRSAGFSPPPASPDSWVYMRRTDHGIWIVGAFRWPTVTGREWNVTVSCQAGVVVDTARRDESEALRYVRFLQRFVLPPMAKVIPASALDPS